ncbi:Uncharacterised protein [Providencia heimbachae]|nr:Uncharacterised protein [Providencia heimbachae]
MPDNKIGKKAILTWLITLYLAFNVLHLND